MASILPAAPSLVPRLIWGLADRSDLLLAGYQIAEALYYATLHMRPPAQRESQAYKLHSKILSHTRLAQTTFQIADGITVFLCARKVLEQLRERSPSFAFYSAKGGREIAWTGASVEVVCSLALSLLKTIHRCLPRETTRGVTDKLTYTATLGFNTQRLSQVPQMARILLEMALAYLSKNPFWSTCSAVASTATLINSLRIRQLSVEAALKDEVQNNIEQAALQQGSQLDSPRTFPLFTPWPDPKYGYIARATVTTRLLSRAHPDGDCPLCLESLNNAQTADLCSNAHPLDIACLNEQLAISVQTLIEKKSLWTEKVIVTNDLKVPLREYYRHHVEINVSKLSQLFQCSQCRAPTLFEPVIEDVLIHCDHRGKRNAEFAEKLTIIDPSCAPLFPYLWTAYNVAQAALATLYRYPELAERLFSIQKFSLAFDLVEFSHTLYALHQKMKAKIYGTEERNLKFSVGYIAGAASLVALSCLVVKGMMGRFLYPHALLKELISTSNALDIRWDAPRIYFFIQSLALSRAVASFALSFFPSQARQNRFNAFAHLCTAAGLSQLRWLSVTQTLQTPLAHVASTGGLISGLDKKNVEQLEMHCLCMVPSSCASHVEHLRSVVHAISDYTSQMLDASHWQFDWFVISQNGFQFDRIYLGVQLKSRALASCASTLFPKMTDITMKAFVKVSDYFSTIGFLTFSGWVGVCVNDTYWLINRT